MKHLIFTAALLYAPMVHAQQFDPAEIKNTTSAHFATITVKNEWGSTSDGYAFETPQGYVVITYITNAGTVGPMCDTDGGAKYEPLGPYRDCPDEVTLRVPDGVVAIPDYAIIEEDDQVEIKLYKYIGG